MWISTARIQFSNEEKPVEDEEGTEQDFFKENDMEDMREPLMQHKDSGSPQKMWRENGIPGEAQYMEAQFIEELSWHLIVSNNVDADMKQCRYPGF